MTMLANVSISSAVTALISNVLQLRDGPAEAVALQANFTYGSGGTNASAWVQTSLDGGLTWCDVANFTVTTASARSVVNLSTLTVIGSPTAVSDGTMTSNTSLGGLIGAHWRVKYTTTGTYAGATTLRIDAEPSRGRLTSLT